MTYLSYGYLFNVVRTPAGYSVMRDGRRVERVRLLGNEWQSVSFIGEQTVILRGFKKSDFRRAVQSAIDGVITFS